MEWLARYPGQSKNLHCVCSHPVLQLRNQSPQEILPKVTQLRLKPQGEVVSHSAVLPCLVYSWLN